MTTEFATGSKQFFGDDQPRFDYAAALTALEASDTPDAKYILGFMYDHGQGVKTDYARARELYTQAWEQGKVASAAAAIAYQYVEGDGVEIDLVEAKRWYDLGADALVANADANNRFALYWLANANLDGQLVDENIPKSLQLFERAGKLGFVDAMLMVAYLYQEGGSDAFEQDLEKAYEWYSAAAAKGSASALCVMAQLHAQGMVDDASPAKAVELYEQAFNELNSSEALVGLSALYMDDTFAGLQQDVPKALALLEQAAAMDDDEAMLTLGQLYLGEMSEQVSADHALARKWLEAAADRDNTDALNTLGFLHFSGEAGYAKDVDMAISLHERAAGLKEIEAMNLLGQLYFSGVEGDVEIDFAKSMHWFKKAAAHGSALAMSTIGDMYEEGMGVDKDEKLAAEWHAKAEEAGDDEDWEDDCCDDEDCDGCGDDHEHEQDHDEE